MRIMQEMSLMEKLNILSDAAKYDVACTSSGSNRRGDGKGIGNTVNAGICHSFSADGRCISLLKILFTNVFMIANTVRTGVPTTCRGRRLRRMKSVA